MNRPDDKAENLPEELASAYRALPPTGPSTALDARVRAAVAAELGATSRPQPRAVTHLWRRRVPLAPLATAAALLLAIGTGYLLLPWSRPPAELHHPRDGVVPAAAAPLADRKQALAREGPASFAAAPAQEMVRIQESSSQLTATGEGASLAELAAARTVNEPRRLVERMTVANSLVAAPPPVAPPVAAQPVATADDALLAEVPVTLDAVRRLLQARQRETARALLQRWQSQHRDAPVPEDLRPLLHQTGP